MQIHKYEQGLKDRVAIVTGAALGNGKAFCERLVQEGAIVVIADVVDASDTLRALKENGGRGMAVQVDLTKPEGARDLMQQTLDAYGRIDILVHNVGLYEEEPFELISFERWKRMLDLHLHSLFLTVQGAIPAMKQHNFGRIIILSSDTVWLGTPYLTHYVTAKAGMLGFTRSLAAEMGKYGITINAITVGLTASQQHDNGTPSQSMLEHIIPSQAVHRADEPEDIANVVAFLALPASGIITGQAINVDGGVARH